MNWVEAAGWGLAGGLAAGLLALMTAVSSAGFRWPWKRDQVAPRLFVLGCGLVLGALIASAAHSQMSGGWPAFVMGACAPATIRGLLSGVEVHPKVPSVPVPARVPALQSASPEEVRENAG